MARLRIAMRLRAALVAAAIAGFVFDGAAADNDQKAAATALFDEALRLMDQGKYAEACPKFAHSQELAPSGGTLLNLARCYEKNGQRASAWLSYKEAAARANSAKKRDMEKLALDAAKKLEPKLAKMTLVVRAPIQGLEVRRDGKPVAPAEIGVSTPIDPGSYRIEASAPERKSFATTVEIPDRAENHSVEIPSLEPVPAAPPVVAPSAPPEPRPERPIDSSSRSKGSTERALGIGIGVAGIVGLGVGTYFGLRAKHKNDDASTHCRTDTQCDATGLELDDQAHQAATVSTIAFAAGGGLLATGMIVFLTAPKGTETTAAIRVEPNRSAPSVRVSIGKRF